MPTSQQSSCLLALPAQPCRRDAIFRERVWADLAHARENGRRLGRPAMAAFHADQVRKLYRTGATTKPPS